MQHFHLLSLNRESLLHRCFHSRISFSKQSQKTVQLSFFELRREILMMHREDDRF